AWDEKRIVHAICSIIYFESGLGAHRLFWFLLLENANNNCKVRGWRRPAPRLRLTAIRSGVLFLGFLCLLDEAVFSGDGHWVTTWACGPQLTEPGNLPPAPLANSTLRQFVHVTIGGKDVRVRFSNAYGTNALTINSAHVALASGTGSAGTGTINTNTDRGFR